MAVFPSERLIEARLSDWGLARDDQSPLSPAASKNRTILCRHRKGRRVLVKVADGPSNAGVVREGDILALLSSLAQRKGSPLQLPRLFALDRSLGMVAIEWLSPSETLHSYHRRTGRYGAPVSAQIGRAIGHLHRRSAEDPDGFAVRDAFREESDLLECFLRMRPEFYARLSRAGIEFFSGVQAAGAAVEALQALSEAQERNEGGCLLHGDLKQANLLRVARSRGQALVLIDWELSFWGDPARDLGSILADYALGRLAPEHESEVISSPTLHSVSRALLWAYARERGVGFALEEGFLFRVVRWAGVALLFYVYGMTHYEGEFSIRARRLTEQATEMLAAPGRWPSRLWGAAA